MKNMKFLKHYTPLNIDFQINTTYDIKKSPPTPRACEMLDF